MLIPAKDGHFYYEGRRCIDYHCFVDGFQRIIEVFTTEDGKKYLGEFVWDDLNDVQKYVCEQRGWNLDAKGSTIINERKT